MAEDIQNMTGQDNFKRAPQYKIDELHVQGDRSKHKFYQITEGHFKIKHVSQEPDKEKGYLITDAGVELKVVFLKIRRILSEYKKATNSYIKTSEHNKGDDIVTLYGADGGNRIGVASDLRNEFQGLRTQQIVYVFVPSMKKVMKLVVKGSSLGSESKAEDVLGFYQYLGTFNTDNQRVHEYITKLVAIPEGDYFTTSFIRGEKLTDEQIPKIEELIREVHTQVTAIDDYYKEKHAKFAVPAGATGALPVIQVEVDEPDTVEYPEEEISPEDIPF
jgi:hypothetical protein